ncbi:MAG TPA: TIGR01777 family oxidoreductase [Thermoanaerobaculia bacterium]|nr:TIGR01777 family oxidoreductase [Thermoanaerobaculia bacterium]
MTLSPPRRRRIVIPGGTGHVGGALARTFFEAGDDVVVLSRTPRALPWRSVVWDARSRGEWTSELDGADAVINLTGRSVDCRYGDANRREILSSRIESTRVVGEAIASVRRPPRVWLQAATATIYAHRYDAPNDEARGLLGGTEVDAPEIWRFSIDVATAWERALREAVTPDTRKVALRSAIMMSPEPGGAFDVLLKLVRRGLGGHAGDGRQFVSWIHVDDFVAAVRWLIARDDLSGPVNLASPNPVPNAAFMRELRRAWGAPFGLPATPAMLEIGAFFLRTETELILKSRRVVPGRLLDSGFAFAFPTWPKAANDLCRRWRAARGLRRSA